MNALTSEILEHQGTFRTPSDQIQFITKTLKDRTFVSVSADIVIVTIFIRFKSIYFFFPPLTEPDLQVYLLIHNIDGPMLRGEKTQSALGQLASLPNLHLVASLDHINAPLGRWRN